MLSADISKYTDSTHLMPGFTTWYSLPIRRIFVKMTSLMLEFTLYLPITSQTESIRANRREVVRDLRIAFVMRFEPQDLAMWF